MSDKKVSFDNFMHVGIVVEDLDRTIETLEKVFGIGPFKMLNFPPDNVDESEIEMTYHGKPADFKAKFCFANVGNTELEIIQPISGDSVWFDFLKEKGEGIHHIKFSVPSLIDTKEYLEGESIEMTQSGSAVGGNLGKTWAYFDATDKAGMIIEVLNEKKGEKIL